MENKYLPIDIYRHNGFSMTNGVSSRASIIYVLHAEGIYDDHYISDNDFKFKAKNNVEYKYLVPMHSDENLYIFGGNLAYSTDSRLGSIAYHIHDRYYKK